MAWMTPEETREAAQKKIEEAFALLNNLPAADDSERRVLATAQENLNRAREYVKLYGDVRKGGSW